MKKNTKVLFLISLFLLAKSTFAYNVLVESDVSNATVGSEFFVDILLDTAGSSVNGVEGIILFDTSKANFVRSETGQSFVTNWIEFPELKDNSIIFSGITPNGFTDFTNLTTGEKSNGKIVRLIFLAKNTGNFVLNTKDITVAANDGDGTTTKINDVQETILLKNAGEINKYTQDEKIKPTITAYVVNEPNLFNSQDTLVFNAIDKESGIEGVYLKNKKNDWIKINSPYLLEESDRKGIITVRAVDFSGNTKSISIFPNIKDTFVSNYFVYVCLLIGLIIFFYFKINVKKKK